MSVPEVTVLTAVRNGTRYLSETIASIRAQTFSDWEYIIVDDNSDDDTVELVKAAQSEDPRLRLIRRDSSDGPYVAANDGLREARGRYIVRIDADDLCPPHRIKRQLEFLAAHREYRACVSYWRGFNDNGPISNTVTSIPGNPRVFRWALLLRGPSIHSSVCLAREAMNEIGGYRELRLSQDYRLWCELTRRGWLGTIPEVLCYVRYHEKRESFQHRTLQAECALDVLSDHLTALTGETWSREELEALRAVGLSLPISVDRGIEMLDRWDRLWQVAPDLAPQDREELAQLSAFRRWKHLRNNARRQPLRVLRGLLKLATTNYRFVIPAPKVTIT
jgi:glycosyltransferase involved in cell wall biosynthesis